MRNIQMYKYTKKKKKKNERESSSNKVDGGGGEWSYQRVRRNRKLSANAKRKLNEAVNQ